jgi:hypothetical protein
VNIKTRVNLGIAIAHAKHAGSRRLNHKEIAAYCDCSWQAIWHIEQAALKKLRRRTAQLKLN